MTNVRIAAALVALAAATLTPSMAVAEPTSERQVEGILVQEGAQTLLVLEFDAPLGAEVAADEAVQLVGPAEMTYDAGMLEVEPLNEPSLMGDDGSTAVTPDGWEEGPIDDAAPIDEAPAETEVPVEWEGPEYAPIEGTGGTYKSIYCNVGYGFGDGNGFFSVQRKCGEGSAAWGYKMSPTLIAICVSNTLSERGMRYILDGAVKQQSGHPNVGCTYNFHGLWRGVNKGDKVDWDDRLRFRHTIGSGGWANVYMSGKLWFRGPKPS